MQQTYRSHSFKSFMLLSVATYTTVKCKKLFVFPIDFSPYSPKFPFFSILLPFLWFHLFPPTPFILSANSPGSLLHVLVSPGLFLVSYSVLPEPTFRSCQGSFNHFHLLSVPASHSPLFFLFKHPIHSSFFICPLPLPAPSVDSQVNYAYRSICL